MKSSNSSSAGDTEQSKHTADSKPVVQKPQIRHKSQCSRQTKGGIPLPKVHIQVTSASKERKAKLDAFKQ